MKWYLRRCRWQIASKGGKKKESGEEWKRLWGTLYGKNKKKIESNNINLHILFIIVVEKVSAEL